MYTVKFVETVAFMLYAIQSITASSSAAAPLPDRDSPASSKLLLSGDKDKIDIHENELLGLFLSGEKYLPIAAHEMFFFNNYYSFVLHMYVLYVCTVCCTHGCMKCIFVGTNMYVLNIFMYICLCMYVCMYVCILSCAHICTCFYVCMYVCM